MLIAVAYAQGGALGGGAGGPLGSLFTLLPLMIIFAIFYLLIIRPQQKQRRDLQQMLANLKRGDRVVTRGGLIGTVDKVEEQRLRLDMGNNLKLHVQRDYIDRLTND